MSKKYYTFTVSCTFEMQYTFTEDEVEPDSDGDEGSVEPTRSALKAVEDELQEYLSQNYMVAEVEVSTDSDMICHDPRNPAVE